MESLEGHLRRYENQNTPGFTDYNAKVKKIKKKIDKMEGKEIPGNHTIGPPPGHTGHHQSINVSNVVRHDVGRCAECPSTDLTPELYMSKCVLDFVGASRYLTWVRHEGYSMKCPQGHITKPNFPGIQDSFLGPEALHHVLMYAPNETVDRKIAYYFDELNHKKISYNVAWNARKALSFVLAHSIEHIIEELRKAKFLQLDESRRI